MKYGSLFTGYGGLDLAVEKVLGAQAAWFAENAPDPARVIAHHWPGVPNHGDVATLDWRRVEKVDILTGGFPCQDISAAGRRREGMTYTNRSGLWHYMADAVATLRPHIVVIENVRGILSAPASNMESCKVCVGNAKHPTLRALGAILGDMADIGYDVAWHGLRAADVGAPHVRFRIFAIAWPRSTHTRRETIRLRGRLHASESPVIGRRRSGDSHSAIASDTRLDALSQLDPHHLATTGGRGRVDPEFWREFAPALIHWERVTGIPVPDAVEIGTRGQHRLAAPFVEWLQGLPPGWVTDVPGISRTQQLRMLGNGVVPRQAAAALDVLLEALP